MECSWLHRCSRSRLLVFCCGWAMDHHPFKAIASGALDVLMIHDYTDLPQKPVDLPFKEYGEVHLLGWSMGVWAGQWLFGERRELFSATIALNGTLKPIDDDFGITRQISEATMQHWSEPTRESFYRRMCGDREVLARFKENVPQRTLASQQRELASLLVLSRGRCDEPGFYRRAVVMDRDRIIPTKNQLNFWGEDRASLLSGSHFPFYQWDSWELLLRDLSATNPVAES